MSYQLVDLVLKHSKEKGMNQLVLVQIASYANGHVKDILEDNEAFPSQAALAERVGVTPRQIKNIIDKIAQKENSELVITEVGNGHRSTRYHIRLTISEPEAPLAPPPPPIPSPIPSPTPSSIQDSLPEVIDSDDADLIEFQPRDEIQTPTVLESTSSLECNVLQPKQLLNLSINQESTYKPKNLLTRSPLDKNLDGQIGENSPIEPKNTTEAKIAADKSYAENQKRTEEYKNRIREALGRNAERQIGQLKVDLRWVPESLLPLIDAFVQASKIIPIRSDQSFWIREAREQVEAHLRPKDITDAVEHAREQGMTIKSPKSITVFARDFQAQRVAEKASQTSTVRNSDGSFNF